MDWILVEMGEKLVVGVGVGDGVMHGKRMKTAGARSSKHEAHLDARLKEVWSLFLHLPELLRGRKKHACRLLLELGEALGHLAGGDD